MNLFLTGGINDGSSGLKQEQEIIPDANKEVHVEDKKPVVELEKTE